LKTVNTTCGYCSTGCSLSVIVNNGEILSVKGTQDYPVNQGFACVKGLQFLNHLDSVDRATFPLLKDEHGDFQKVDWRTSLEVFCSRFKKIQECYGKNSVAFISTGQMVNEEFALLGALTKFGMGIVHGDGNTRQCMASAAVAYKESFGFDAPPYSYSDFEHSDVIVLFGSNLMIAHPIMWTRINRNKKNPRIFVIDPRKTTTAKSSKVTHLPIQPKTDIILLYGLANALIENNLIDTEYIKRHTNGFRDFKEHVSSFTIDYVSEKTGLSIDQLNDLVQSIPNKRASFWWTMGINQGHQAVRTAQAIINIALLTGNIGKPGTGSNSITGQCNAMGSRLFSNTSELFCGHSFSNPVHRKKISKVLGIDEHLIPTESSWVYDKILRKIDEGVIRGLWIICTNPGHSWIDNDSFKRTIEKLDFLVVQDIFYNTLTTKMADLILPSGGCGEKDGTFINSERRFGVVKKIKDPPGDAFSDFEIFKKIADAWGCKHLFNDWTTPQDVFNILKTISRDQPCDFSGISGYEMIEQHRGIQWPFPNGFRVGEESRLFVDGSFFFPDNKANFFFEQVYNVPTKISKEYPFILMTGRGSVGQFHTETRTGKVPFLSKFSPKMPFIEVNPFDAAELSVSEGETVMVSSKQGEKQIQVKITDSVQPKQVFIPMHHPESNILTSPIFDPYSRQPSYKYTAVKILKM
jgi:assimilatory nitrate reductase catalytic subunit